MVNIGLNIFLTTFGAFYTIPSGGFITSYGDLSGVYTPSPQVAVLEEPPEEEGGHNEGGGRSEDGWPSVGLKSVQADRLVTLP